MECVILLWWFSVFLSVVFSSLEYDVSRHDFPCVFHVWASLILFTLQIYGPEFGELVCHNFLKSALFCFLLYIVCYRPQRSLTLMHVETDMRPRMVWIVFIANSCLGVRKTTLVRGIPDCSLSSGTGKLLKGLR